MSMASYYTWGYILLIISWCTAWFVTLHFLNYSHLSWFPTRPHRFKIIIWIFWHYIILFQSFSTKSNNFGKMFDCSSSRLYVSFRVRISLASICVLSDDLAFLLTFEFFFDILVVYVKCFEMDFHLRHLHPGQLRKDQSNCVPNLLER